MKTARKRKDATLRILGLEIEKKTNFTSLAAFVLSIWGVSQATWFFLRGSNPELIQPDRVIIFEDNCYSSKWPIYNFVIPISIINTAQEQFESVIRDIELRFSLDKPYVYDSEYYVNYGNATVKKYGVVDCDKDKNKDLDYFVEATSLVPIEVIRGGDAHVRNIQFVPAIPVCEKGGEDCYARNYLRVSSGLEEFKKRSMVNELILFEVIMRYDDGKHSSKKCALGLNQDIANALSEYHYVDTFCTRPSE